MYILALGFSTLFSFVSTTSATVNNKKVIPSEAIRLRILANSNLDDDQEIKRVIRDKVKASIDGWVQDLDSYGASHQVIESHLQEIDAIAKQELANAKIDQNVQVTLGPAEFPTKMYGDYLYPAGTYEAVVVSIGEAAGDNWWCVLYPPLCFLDFNSNTAVDKNEKSTSDEKKSSKEKKGQKSEFLVTKIFKKIFD